VTAPADAFTSAILRDFKPQPGENYPFGGPLLFEPGERWHYGASTDVVGKLVEKLSGQKLEDYFHQPGLTIPEPIGGGGLTSTANDRGRFMRMLLNGGELDGARVLKAETATLMGQNKIGALSVPALKTALPRSADFTFIADGRDKWGLGFLITTDQVPGKRSPGSLSWGGINNTFFWIDQSRGIAGVILMQYLPFADIKALAAYDAFERSAYQLVSAER
jgi:CubicO group peptidase (beta-lactamase class C family)